MNEQAIQSFHAEVLACYPDKCQVASACGMFAVRASELAGRVAAGLIKPEIALERAQQDAAVFENCPGQNIDQPDTPIPLCGKLGSA